MTTRGRRARGCRPALLVRIAADIGTPAYVTTVETNARPIGSHQALVAIRTPSTTR
jgi:hypothetical protein